MTAALAEPPRRIDPEPAPPTAAPTPASAPRTRPEPAAGGVTLHLPSGPLELPVAAPDFATFRAWTLADDFPEEGKFSYLAGRMEIDLMHESWNTHGTLKGLLSSYLIRRAEEADLGVYGVDSSKIVAPDVGLSCEPDVVVVLWETIEAGRVAVTAKANRPNDVIEVVGGPDLVVEVVSDSSTSKDRRLEPPLLFAAGVTEFWRLDARREGAEVEFDLHRRGDEDWEPVEPDADGFRRSEVLGRSYRVTRRPPRAGFVTYRVEERE